MKIDCTKLLSFIFIEVYGRKYMYINVVSWFFLCSIKYYNEIKIFNIYSKGFIFVVKTIKVIMLVINTIY